MRTCALCGAILATPLDEYGLREEPVCSSCFLALPSQRRPVYEWELLPDDERDAPIIAAIRYRERMAKHDRMIQG